MTVIAVRDVWKRYRRPPSEVPRRLRHLRDLGGKDRPYALRGVSFDVQAGESVGLLGANGSGKSSLLRILAGTSRQTSGSVVISEPTYGLLTLGEGMHPLMTGRENAVTGAMLSGLSRAEAEAAVPEIADFSELREALDRPLRTYSEGMKLRLAFATSMVVDPRVLLIDEVLAVGDLRFRERCLRRLRDLRRNGVTIVLVSHELAQIRELCDRALWLVDGQVRQDGPSGEVVEQYELEMFAALRAEQADTAGLPGHRQAGTGEVQVTAVRLRTSAGATDDVPAGSSVTVDVHYANPGGVPDAVLALSVHDAEGRLCLDLNTEHDRSALPDLEQSGVLSLELDRLDLASGDYTVDAGFYRLGWSHTYDYWWQITSFQVHGSRPSRGVLVPPVRWTAAALP